MTSYRSFLEAKLAFSQHSGFAVPADVLHSKLKPHQRDIVRWALHGGRRVIFASFGLGKSFMQLEVMRQIALHEGGRQLIIAPLGVRQKFRADAAPIMNPCVTAACMWTGSYLRAAEQDVSAPSLFDLCGVKHTRGAA